MDKKEMASPGEGLTRREMLKKSALVGAVAWAAPVVSSFSTPAFAQVVVSPASCTSWECGDPHVQCGSSGFSDFCECDVDTEGNPFCWENISCAEPGVTACTTNVDCPAGWRCATSCCGTTCLPECGSNVTTTQTQGGLTAAG